MITIVNNCLQFIELVKNLKQQYWVPNSTNDASAKFETLLQSYHQLRLETARILLDQSFLDLELHFNDLLTSKWLASPPGKESIAVQTIRVTLEDYFQDYRHLKPSNFEYVISEAQHLIVKRYITAMLQRKLNLKTYDDCETCTKRIVLEADQLKNFFGRMTSDSVDSGSPFDVVIHLAEVLKCKDPELLSLELLPLVEKYPDITEDHLVRLLSMRNDISRSEVREKVAFSMESQKHRRAMLSNPNSVFKQIVLQDSFLSWKP